MAISVWLWWEHQLRRSVSSLGWFRVVAAAVVVVVVQLLKFKIYIFNYTKNKVVTKITRFFHSSKIRKWMISIQFYLISQCCLKKVSRALYKSGDTLRMFSKKSSCDNVRSDHTNDDSINDDLLQLLDWKPNVRRRNCWRCSECRCRPSESAANWRNWRVLQPKFVDAEIPTLQFPFWPWTDRFRSSNRCRRTFWRETTGTEVWGRRDLDQIFVQNIVPTFAGYDSPVRASPGRHRWCWNVRWTSSDSERNSGSLQVPIRPRKMCIRCRKTAENVGRSWCWRREEPD